MKSHRSIEYMNDPVSTYLSKSKIVRHFGHSLRFLIISRLLDDMDKRNIMGKWLLIAHYYIKPVNIYLRGVRVSNCFAVVYGPNPCCFSIR